MKSTGVNRKVDQLGRVVLPIELRQGLDIEKGTPIEIFIEEDGIILKKYSPAGACVITGDVGPNNKVYASGIILSPAGAQILNREIREQLNSTKNH